LDEFYDNVWGVFLKRFEFRLEKVLQVRKIRKTLVQEELGALVRERDRVERALILCQRRHIKALDEARNALLGPIDPLIIGCSLRHESLVRDEISEKRGELEEKERLVERTRNRLMLRTQEVKTLERYKERQFSRYRTKFWWKQAKILDEISLERFSRKERW